MPGDSEASISVSIGHVPTTVVSTGPLAFACDESQYGRGDGPCLHAAGTGEVTEIADMQAETRWPAFVQEAAERGVLSSLSIPLPMSAGISASLNIYARRPHAFDEESRAVATRFVPYAAIAVTNMQAYRDARDLTAEVTRTSR
jgi:GAF domain-containing protein